MISRELGLLNIWVVWGSTWCAFLLVDLFRVSPCFNTWSSFGDVPRKSIDSEGMTIWEWFGGPPGMDVNLFWIQFGYLKTCQLCTWWFLAVQGTAKLLQIYSALWLYKRWWLTTTNGQLGEWQGKWKSRMMKPPTVAQSFKKLRSVHITMQLLDWIGWRIGWRIALAVWYFLVIPQPNVCVSSASTTDW